jgi:hypothetical protein
MTYRKTQPTLRKILLGYEDGLTINELIVKTGLDGSNLRRALADMDDVYIDRWLASQHQKPAQAVYCIVKIPEDCPKPEKAPNEKRTYNRRVR